MRTLLIASGFFVALGLTALATAGDAEAAPLGGSKISIAPDVFIGFGTRCTPRRRVYVVRRHYATRSYVRPTYIYSPYIYSPYTYAYPRVRLGYGHYGHYGRYGHSGRYGHGHARHRSHGSRRVIGRRR